jgi:hypothetical protein
MTPPTPLDRLQSAKYQRSMIYVRTPHSRHGSQSPQFDNASIICPLPEPKDDGDAVIQR